MTDVEDNKVSSFNGMNILLIILAVIIVVVILALIFKPAGHMAIDALKNIFKFGKEYQLSDAFKIVN